MSDQQVLWSFVVTWSALSQTDTVPRGLRVLLGLMAVYFFIIALFFGGRLP